MKSLPIIAIVVGCTAIILAALGVTPPALAGADTTPWYVWPLLLAAFAPWLPTAAGGAVKGWKWLRPRLEPLATSRGNVIAIVAALLIGVAIGYALAGSRDPAPADPKPNPAPVEPKPVEPKPAPPAPSPPPSPKTAVTYVYEKDAGGIPPAVAAGISELNSQGLLATTYEDDTEDGTGEIPEQYKTAILAARKAGLPALIVQSKDAVWVTPKPTTKEQVIEAAK